MNGDDDNEIEIKNLIKSLVGTDGMAVNQWCLSLTINNYCHFMAVLFQ